MLYACKNVLFWWGIIWVLRDLNSCKYTNAAKAKQRLFVLRDLAKLDQEPLPSTFLREGGGLLSESISDHICCTATWSTWVSVTIRVMTTKQWVPKPPQSSWLWKPGLANAGSLCE